jgi:hypothetical protein
MGTKLFIEKSVYQKCCKDETVWHGCHFGVRRQSEAATALSIYLQAVNPKRCRAALATALQIYPPKHATIRS